MEKRRKMVKRKGRKEGSKQKEVDEEETDEYICRPRPMPPSAWQWHGNGGYEAEEATANANRAATAKGIEGGREAKD
jgi:hypothetical protein